MLRNLSSSVVLAEDLLATIKQKTIWIYTGGKYKEKFTWMLLLSPTILVKNSPRIWRQNHETGQDETVNFYL